MIRMFWRYGEPWIGRTIPNSAVQILLLAPESFYDEGHYYIIVVHD